MNKLEDIVVSLETARKLVETEIKIACIFHWFGDKSGYFVSKWVKDGDELFYPFRNLDEPFYVCPAPEFTELLRLFPKDYHLLVRSNCIELWHDVGSGDAYLVIDRFEFAETLQDKLAEIIIELKKREQKEKFE